MASRNGSATAVPMPRRKARRRQRFRVIIFRVILRLLLSTVSRRDWNGRLCTIFVNQSLEAVIRRRPVSRSISSTRAPVVRTPGRCPRSMSASSPSRQRANSGNCALEQRPHFGRASRRSCRWAACRVASTGNLPSWSRHLPIAVVVLQPEAQRVHLAVAGRAHGVGAMLLHLLRAATRWRRPTSSSSGGTSGGGGGGGRAENVLQDVLAANHHRGARRDSSKPSARCAWLRMPPRCVGGQFHPAELRPFTPSMP